jgi:hypothetical protein
MIRIRFNSQQDLVRGDKILVTNTTSRYLRGDIFEILEADRKLLDAHQIHYTILPQEANGSDQEIRMPVTHEIQRRNGD